MAKRKRLSPAAITVPDGVPAPETKALNGWVGVRARAPIADVSRDAATQSAFEEVAQELKSARDEGRMILQLPLEAVEDTYLVRDRLSADSEEMTVLQDSLRARGQQTPIEVVDLGQGRYGLISGWRRMQALRALNAASDVGDFAHVQALIRAPHGAAEAYCAMVEENEIRADLSFYERAHIAVKAAEQGVYPDAKTAVQSLFSAARPPKRSKIVGFTALVVALGDVLRWPETIPEKQGLALVAALKKDSDLGKSLHAAVKRADAQDAAEERAALDRALYAAQNRPEALPTAEIIPGVAVQGTKGKIVLSGAAVDGDLLDDLRAWIAARAAQ